MLSSDFVSSRGQHIKNIKRIYYSFLYLHIYLYLYLYLYIYLYIYIYRYISKSISMSISLPISISLYMYNINKRCPWVLQRGSFGCKYATATTEGWGSSCVFHQAVHLKNDDSNLDQSISQPANQSNDPIINKPKWTNERTNHERTSSIVKIPKQTN